MREAKLQTVLVVDDNAENRALAQATLEDEGIAVVIARSGEDGLAAFDQARPDAILMDIRMPGIDGVAAAERIRAMPGGDEVAIVYVTAQRDVETFDRALASGGDDFITKPFRPAELIVRLQTALRLRRLAAERSELVAQLKQQRDDLLRLELYKEQLSAFVVHDLKNPVHAIELHAQRVLRNPAADHRSRDAAAKIHDETRALMQMITNLLDIGKADEGRLQPARQTIDGRTLVLGALEDLAARATSAGVALAADAGTASLDVDPDLMGRVVVNLVDNAIRHAPEGSEIRVTVAVVGDGAEVRVADAGRGVPPDQRERIFDRFVSRGDQATRTNRGLGLAFCKLAVEAHGGKIWVEDGEPGAVFCVRIARAS